MKKPTHDSLLTAPLDELGLLDVTDPVFKANPFPFYRRLRSEAPVFSIRLPRDQQAWLVTRYADALAVLKDGKTFVKDPANAMSDAQRRRAPKMPPMLAALERNLLALDDADHARLKALVHQAFTPQMIERMRETTQAVTDRAIDRAEEQRDFDLVAGFGLEVPLAIIGKILGVPPKDHPRFARWTRAFVSVGSARHPLLLIPSVVRFVWYLRALIAKRRSRPEDDLVSALVRAQEGSDRLTNDEVLALVFLLLSAGHETTVNLIASGCLALLENPPELARLRSEPALVGVAVEELLRYVVPAEMATVRYATHDVEIAGTTIGKGELVVAGIGAANRDPEHFVDPETLDLARADNRHLSFGQGVHYCLGAALSRMEAAIALTSLLRRAPNLRLRVPAAELRWRPGLIVRGLEALPATF